MKNYFAHYAPVIMDLLGIKAWTKDSNQKDSLLEEQKQKLKALSFDENFITGFCEALKKWLSGRFFLKRRGFGYGRWRFPCRSLQCRNKGITG